ncbi:MAG: apolipoprotein N-acyltransferase [Maritimibacter sp.]
MASTFDRLQNWSHASRLRLFGVAAAAGGFAALGQAPFGLFPATLIGFALGFGLWQSAQDLRRAAFAGWALGAGYFLVTLHWIVEPFLVDIARHGWMAPFAPLLMAGGLALFWGGGAALAYRLAKRGAGDDWRGKVRAVFGFVIWLTLAEMLRGWVFTGFPWGAPGLVWIDTPLGVHARLIGVIGLSFATFLLSVSLWQVAQNRWHARIGWVAAILSLGLSGWAILRDPIDPAPDAPIVRLIQPNAPQHQKWDPLYARQFFDRALALSGADASFKPDLVVWPETSVPSVLGRDAAVEAMVAQAGRGAPVVAGIFDREGAATFNALAMFDPKGAPAWVYRKFHLVPFGEYMPLGELAGRFNIHGLAARDGYGFAAGAGPKVFELPGRLGKVQPIICYEAIFPRDIRSAPERPDWILQATNDGWFGNFAGPQQHLVQAQFRAIEMGLPVLRAANTGVTAVIDARGRVVESLPLGTSGFLDARLPMALPETVFARFGQGPVLVFLILFAFALVLPRGPKGVDHTAPPQ